MKVILSIKPQFVEKIFAGEKKYEFRRSIFANPEVKTVVIYASSPVQKVVGEFEIETILHDKISTLWDRTCNHSGISKTYFTQYFVGKNKGFAIKIRNVKKYKRSKCIRKDFNRIPPQSFIYL